MKVIVTDINGNTFKHSTYNSQIMIEFEGDEYEHFNNKPENETRIRVANSMLASSDLTEADIEAANVMAKNHFGNPSV